MPKKIPRKANTSFTRTSNKGRQALFKSQQKTSTPKKIQNDKTLKSTNYKSTLKLSCKIPNDRISLFEDKVISSNSSDSENQESDEHEFNKDESREKDEDIIMQDVKSTSSEEEDSTESSDNENMKKINYSEETEESEEENSNVGNVDEKELGDKTEDDMDEIIEDTTKISLKKKGKDKEEIKSQYETTTTEVTLFLISLIC
ncbi:hypothetical protein RclHR1_05080006 [Rhizophagus clarus]|uniref:Uncharacterized protein n=1 Tax=Rhizophagus clarus TaxID=94130 RepID=A0A2Z6S2L5_9GLOM|nr:hypothetical protein RclHR1_05080006 [Rhizophagus clarus]